MVRMGRGVDVDLLKNPIIFHNSTSLSLFQGLSLKYSLWCVVIPTLIKTITLTYIITDIYVIILSIYILIILFMGSMGYSEL